MRKIFLKIGISALIFSGKIIAEDNKSEANSYVKSHNIELNNIENDVVNNFKNKISKIDSYVAYFKQEEISKNEEFFGAVIFKKNVGIRFNYFEPHQLLLTITKKNVYLYDYEMENLSIVNASESPIYFLLKHDNNRGVNFGENLKIIKATKDSSFYYIDLFHLDTEAIVKVVFNYLENQIQSIDILDSQKQSIKITFEKIIKIDDSAAKKIDNEIFRIKNPKIYGKPHRFTRNDLEELYTKK